MADRVLLVARLWSLLTLLYLVAARRLLALLLRLLRPAPAPAPRLHQVNVNVAAGQSPQSVAKRVGQSVPWEARGGVRPAHPDSPVGRIRHQIDVTVDGDGLHTLPSDELHQHTLAVLAEHAQRIRRLA